MSTNSIDTAVLSEAEMAELLGVDEPSAEPVAEPVELTDDELDAILDPQEAE